MGKYDGNDGKNDGKIYIWPKWEKLGEVAKLKNDRNSKLNRTLWYNSCGYSEVKKGVHSEKEKKNKVKSNKRTQGKKVKIRMYKKKREYKFQDTHKNTEKNERRWFVTCISILYFKHLTAILIWDLYLNVWIFHFPFLFWYTALSYTKIRLIWKKYILLTGYQKCGNLRTAYFLQFLLFW